MATHSVGTRFFAKVDKTSSRIGCWLWTGARSTGGYGCLSVGGKQALAHRFSYEMAHGPIPAGKLACHKCDVRCCVNPDHIFIGTHTDNARDRAAKGR